MRLRSLLRLRSIARLIHSEGGVVVIVVFLCVFLGGGLVK